MMTVKRNLFQCPAPHVISSNLFIRASHEVMALGVIAASGDILHSTPQREKKVTYRTAEIPLSRNMCKYGV